MNPSLQKFRQELALLRRVTESAPLLANLPQIEQKVLGETLLVYAEGLILCPTESEVRVHIERNPIEARRFLVHADRLVSEIEKRHDSISGKTDGGTAIYCIASAIIDFLEMCRKDFPDRWENETI